MGWMFHDIQNRSYVDIRGGFRWNIPEAFNMGTACADHQDPSATALLSVRPGEDHQKVSFGELTRCSDALANVLRAAGIRRGDRVGIVLPQTLEAGLSYLAAFKLGAVAVPISVLFGVEALAYRLANSRARALITDPSGAAKVEAIGSDLPDLRLLLVTGETRSQPGRLETASFDEAVGSASSELSPASTASEDPALLIYTSGTTGPPKGALHAHRFLFGSFPAVELAHWPLATEGGLFWTPADWAWVAALMDVVLPAWFFGLPVLATQRGKFDPEWAFSVIGRHRVANAYLPPTALRMMRLVDDPSPTESLRSVMTGGETLGAELLEWGREALGVTIEETYGQTEANLTVGNASTFWPVRPGSMGRPYPGHDVRVERDDGSEADPGELGEVVVRPPDPAMFLGYLEAPEEATASDRASALRSGDLVHRDEDGYLWFRGRRDDLINSAGYRIGPVEIEQCLARHPAVALAGVIGVPDPERGEVIKAFVVPRRMEADRSELEDDLRRFVRERLGGHQYPRKFEFVAELPVTTSGKIRRRELREREAERRVEGS